MDRVRDQVRLRNALLLLRSTAPADGCRHRSVTAQARAEEAILNVSKEREARAKAEAEEAEERRKVAVEEKRQQELLIDVTSHEIRNPVSREDRLERVKY